ncbi:MAG: PQQ-binding-like beta-propeller repeat protein [Verrucomicrobia bacterium]|nr:PQQ-binding-like beta-propeller repeat protein [Verrucomicrobiota bacterium]
MIDLFNCAPTLGVIPVVVQIGPMLIALLSAVVAAVVSALIKLLKPSTIKAFLQIMWRNKLATIVLVAAIAGICHGVTYIKGVLSERGSGGGVVEVGKSDWSAFRGGPDRRGATLDAEDPKAAARVWGGTTKIKTFYSSPGIVGNRIFATSAEAGAFNPQGEGGIVCLDADTGEVVWNYAPRGFRATYSSPSVQSNYLVSGEGLHLTDDARITCLRIDFESNGYEFLWEFRTRSHVESSPCIYNGRAYVGAGDDGLYCIELEPDSDNKPVVKWHLAGNKSSGGMILEGEEALLDCEASPAALDGKVFFCLGMGGKAVVCVDAETGQKLWKVNTPYPVFGAPAVVDGKVIVGMGTGNMIESAEEALESEIQKLRDKGLSEGALEKERAMLGPAGEVWCMDAESGDLVWSKKLARTVLGAVAAADGRLYFGSRDHRLYSLGLDGTGMKEFDSHEPIVTSPAVGKEHVYFVTEAGTLICLDRNSLKPVWDMRIGSGGTAISSPAVGRGHIYVGTTKDGLVCLGGPVVDETYLWAGAMGGEGQSGWVDGSFVPASVKFAWRYPKTETTDTDAEATAITTPVACSTNALYVGMGGARNGLAKVELTDNRRRPFTEAWFCAATHAPGSSAAILGELVYFVSGQPGDKGRYLHTVDVKSGAILSKREVADYAGGQMLLTRNGLLVADREDGLSLLRGEEDSIFLDVGKVVGSPVSGNDMFFVATESGVSALSAVGGENLWRVALPAPVRTGPVVRGETVAVGTTEGVVALRMVDGSTAWTLACGETVGGLVCSDEYIACVTTNREVVLMDWAGEEKVRTDAVAPGITPVLCGAVMLCPKPDGVELVEIESGKKRNWVGNLGWLGGIVTPGIVFDSKMYIGTGERGLVCLRGK